jgi:hypothetical protein
VIIRPTVLGRALRRRPVLPTSVAALLTDTGGYVGFRRIARELFPDAEPEILAARETGASRENARVWAFLRKVEAAFFPTYELDEYDQLTCGIPFVHEGWSYERFHELDLRPGELLLFAICAQPVEPGDDSRFPLLDACERLVPRELLTQIPEDGLPPEELHRRLDDTHFAAAAEFADWLWGETGTAFLDIDEESSIADVDWTLENVHELACQWRRADAILGRIDALATWLEADPPARFAALLDAVLDRDPHIAYQRARRFYDYEITERGLVPITHDEPEAVAL